jgi:hypothetical protein
MDLRQCAGSKGRQDHGWEQDQGRAGDFDTCCKRYSFGL